MSRLFITPLEWSKAMSARGDCLILPSSPTRVGLSIRLGAMGGFIWGIFFTAYYSMLPNFKFAVYASSVCFVTIVIVLLALPSILKIIKECIKEGMEKKDDWEEEDEDEE
jgi:hypothetical protein